MIDFPSVNQRQHPQRNVVISLNLSRASRRDILSGIFDAINRLGDWNVHIIQTREELTAETVRKWSCQDIDGVILAEEGLPDADKELLASTIPTVVLGAHGTWLRRRKTNIAFARIDDLSIGTFAGRELMKLGSFTTAAFLPSEDNGLWSQLRGRGFKTICQKNGLSVITYQPGGSEPAAAFLARLPKPAAVFAACDRVILNALGTHPDATCGLSKQTVLLGVDNDRLICESMRPRLSSIHPDHYGLGMRTARELNALMRKRSTSTPKKVLCAKATLVMRETTVPVAPAARLVQRAIDYIHRNACRGIKCNDVADYLKVSRRLLDLRFRQYASRPVADEILENKLSAVKQALETTDDSLASIATNCGFCNRNHLKNVFKSKTGMSLTDWRTKHHSN
jgi:LacI family transcriptional regulator